MVDPYTLLVDVSFDRAAVSGGSFGRALPSVAPVIPRRLRIALPDAKLSVTDSKGGIGDCHAYTDVA